MVLRSLFAWLFSVFLVQSNVAAAQEVYHCIPKDTRAAGNWIAPEIYIAYNAGEVVALVDDAIIQTFEEGPKEAKVDTDNSKRMSFSWTVKTNANQQYAVMIYRLTILKADLKASFIAVPQGYANTWQTQGKCQKIKG